MKYLYNLLLLSLLTASQETTGTIFEVLDSSLTESETAEQASNIESNEELSSSSTSYESSTPESSSSSSTSVSLSDLKSQNKALKSEQQELLTLLDDTESKLALYKEEANKTESKIESELETMETYLASIQNSKAEARRKQEKEEDEQESEEDEDDEIEVAISLIFLMGIGFVFLLMHGIKSMIGYSLETFLNPAFYSLFVDLTILLILCSAVSLCEYVDVFDDIIDYQLLILGAAIFTFFWLVLGLWLIMAAQSFSKHWYRREKECQDLRNLTHMFQEAQIELEKGEVPRNLKVIYQQFHYVFMRQLFICPTFIPPVTETYLRTDFNFSEYLSRGLADILNQVFQINWLGYVFIIFSMLGWRVLLASGDQQKFIALWVFPGVILLACIVLAIKLNSVYNALVPPPTEQIMLNLPRDNFGRTPDMNENIIPKPDYLKGKLVGKAEIKYCGIEVKPLKMTWGYILTSTYPNRHELLFWGDKFGVDFIIALLQGISVALTLWVTVIIVYYIPLLQDMWELYGLAMIGLCFVLWAGITFYLIPEILRLLTLTSKIEMKKDRRLIEEVIENEKTEKAKVIVRIYRQFKMIYRERYSEEVIINDSVIKNYALEAFNLCKDPESGTVNVYELEDLIALLGVKLNDDELRLFAKECKPLNLSEIEAEGFCKAASTLFTSRKIRPEFVIRVVLERFFKEFNGKVVKEVNLDDLRQFFNEFWWHFTDDDIQDFLWETKFILGDIGTVSISELGGMVRNTIKDYAR